jgi:hypothetical protein
MRRVFLTVLVAGFAVLGAVAPANQAMAGWCNRVYTSYYFDPCVSCPIPTVATCAAPACVTPTTCYTTSEQRCYLEPQVSYRFVTRLEPQTYYVRRAYYDPWSCCSRSYYVPATTYVERSYQVPVTSYVQRCYVEPQTVCPTPGTTAPTPLPSPAPATSEPSATNSRAAARLPAARNGLDRPVYREPARKLDNPPKPVPMPSPQASRSRTLNTGRAVPADLAVTRLPASMRVPQGYGSHSNRILQSP